MLYTRLQIRLLAALAAMLALGLGVREWRAGFPAAADRLERFDRDAARALEPPPRVSSPRARGGERRRVDDAAAAPAPREDPGGPVDLNRADAGELARLPGIGPSLARRIVDERERGGAFASPEALRRVYGLGPRKLIALRGLVAVAREDPGLAGDLPPAAGAPGAGTAGPGESDALPADASDSTEADVDADPTGATGAAGHRDPEADDGDRGGHEPD